MTESEKVRAHKSIKLSSNNIDVKNKYEKIDEFSSEFNVSESKSFRCLYKDSSLSNVIANDNIETVEEKFNTTKFLTILRALKTYQQKRDNNFYNHS